MASIDVKSATGKKAGTADLEESWFGIEPNVPVMHQVVTAQLAARRAGSHNTLTRAQVRGGGAKPWRQKGTGRARQGSIRAPHWRGGGVAHGPKTRNYAQRTPKKMKAAALRGALSDRARNDRVHVVSSIVSGDNPSTRAAAQTLATIVESPHILVIAERDDELTWKSLRNVAGVHLIAAGQLNTYDVLVSDHVVFTEDSLGAFVARVGQQPEGQQ